MKISVSVFLLILSFSIFGQEVDTQKKAEVTSTNNEPAEKTGAAKKQFVVSASTVEEMLSIKEIEAKQDLMGMAFNSNRSLAITSYGFSLTLLLGGAIFLVVNHRRLDKLVDTYTEKLDGIEKTEARLNEKINELDKHNSAHMAFGDILTAQGLIARLSTVMINLNSACSKASEKEIEKEATDELRTVHESIYQMCREIHEVGHEALVKLSAARRELESAKSSTITTETLKKHICVELARIHTLNALAHKRLWGITSSDSDLLKATDEIERAEREAKNCGNQSLLAKIKYNYACYLNLNGNKVGAKNLLEEACRLESRFVRKAKTDPDIKGLDVS